MLFAVVQCWMAKLIFDIIEAAGENLEKFHIWVPFTEDMQLLLFFISTKSSTHLSLGRRYCSRTSTASVSLSNSGWHFHKSSSAPCGTIVTRSHRHSKYMICAILYASSESVSSNVYTCQSDEGSPESVFRFNQTAQANTEDVADEVQSNVCHTFTEQHSHNRSISQPSPWAKSAFVHLSLHLPPTFVPFSLPPPSSYPLFIRRLPRATFPNPPAVNLHPTSFSPASILATSIHKCVQQQSTAKLPSPSCRSRILFLIPPFVSYS